jgi:hypothetical protein
LLLDYSIFEEPRLNGRATGKINKHGRELRMTDNEVDMAKALVRNVSFSSILSLHSSCREGEAEYATTGRSWGIEESKVGGWTYSSGGRT